MHNSFVRPLAKAMSVKKAGEGQERKGSPFSEYLAIQRSRRVNTTVGSLGFLDIGHLSSADRVGDNEKNRGSGFIHRANIEIHRKKEMH